MFMHEMVGQRHRANSRSQRERVVPTSLTTNVISQVKCASLLERVQAVLTPIQRQGIGCNPHG
jgi:hypothetical protein